VVHGQLVRRGFVASEVLAKHDENYMPPEVAEALKPANGALKRRADYPETVDCS
jgi:cytochrome c-type biogenesis protein CcmE